MQLAGLRHEPRVGGEDAVDVRVDLAGVGAERSGQRGRGQVGAAPAERRDVQARGRDALEAGHEDDLVLVERLVDPARAHLDDLRLAVRRVGDDPGLRAGERDRVVAEVGDRHRDERARDALADRDQHVQLPRLRFRRDLVRERDELVRVLPHGGDDADHAPAAQLRLDEPGRDTPDLLRVGDRCAAELHHDEAEAGVGRRRRDGGNGLERGLRHAADCRESPTRTRSAWPGSRSRR